MNEEQLKQEIYMAIQYLGINPVNSGGWKKEVIGPEIAALANLFKSYAKEYSKEREVLSDFPTAWKVMRATDPEQHHEKCSYRQTKRAILCDCAAEKVFIETCKLSSLTNQSTEQDCCDAKYLGGHTIDCTEGLKEQEDK